MTTYLLTQLSDAALLREIATLLAQDRITTAALLAHLAEADARKLYLPAGYPSMYAYCVGELRLSEDAAYKRIQAARVARQFPAIFPMLAEGRLHLAAVCLLAPHLTPENADDLLAVAAGKTKAELEQLLAARFPRTELLAWVTPLAEPASRTAGQLAPGQVEPNGADELVPEPVGGSNESQPVRIAPTTLRYRVTPLAAERYALQVTVGRSTYEKLQYAQNLLGHALPGGDLAEVIDRALDALIPQLERRKFAATNRPRRMGHRSPNPRHVPAAVKRAVWARDGGQCTFVSEAGHRCPARTRLEFDHAEAVARGGQATVAGLRLRCRGHNQYEAERTFGAEFMRHQREQAQRAAEARRQRVEAQRQEAEGRRLEREARAAEAARAKEEAQRQAEQARQETARRRAAAEEVITPLRYLGYSAREAREAAALCEAIPEASLEDRLKRALGYFRPRLLARMSAAASRG